jgi:hypothetical protein
MEKSSFKLKILNDQPFKLFIYENLCHNTNLCNSMPLIHEIETGKTFEINSFKQAEWFLTSDLKLIDLKLILGKKKFVNSGISVKASQLTSNYFK